MTIIESYWASNKEWYGIDDNGNPSTKHPEKSGCFFYTQIQ